MIYVEESKLWLKIFSYIMTDNVSSDFDKDKIIVVEK